MRILQILPELNVGGVERGTLDFSSYLVRHGHHSVVVSNGGSMVKELVEKGGVHYAHPVHKKSLFTAWKMVKVVREIILREKIEIVHARSRVPAWIAFFATRRTEAAFITTCHGHYGSRFFSQVMGWAKIVIAPSQVIARHMIDEYGVPPERLRVIPRSVDLQRFQMKGAGKKGKSTFVISILGRITPLKGHSFFLRAMARVVRSMPNVKIWVIGDPPRDKPEYKEDLIRLSQRLGIQGQVEFLGTRPNVEEYLKKTDVMVLSSVEPESFGRVILEAQAVGVPVVATSVGGVVDIIEHEETGLLVMAKDTEAMARAVLRVLQNPVWARKLVAQARKKVESCYTLEHMAGQTLAVYEELLKRKTIMVIKFGAIGDVVLITPSLKAIRKRYPDADIHCMTAFECRKVLQNCPYIDHLLVMNVHDKERSWWELVRRARKLRSCAFDLVIDFQNNRKSHLLSFLLFPKMSIGFDNKKWGKLLTHPVTKYTQNIAAVPHQFQILEAINIPYPKKAKIELWPTDKDREYVSSLLEGEWLANARLFVGVNLSASPKWPTKNWPLEYVARLCDLLSPYNIRVVLTGVKKDLPAVQEVLKRTKAKPAILVGKTDILQLACLIERCAVYLTPDSAPLHIASAVKTPVITFFGPTSPERHLPPGEDIRVLHKEMKCSPCYSGKCKIGTHACMREITPEEVFALVSEIVGVTA